MRTFNWFFAQLAGLFTLVFGLVMFGGFLLLIVLNARLLAAEAAGGAAFSELMRLPLFVFSALPGALVYSRLFHYEADSLNSLLRAQGIPQRRLAWGKLQASFAFSLALSAPFVLAFAGVSLVFFPETRFSGATIRMFGAALIFPHGLGIVCGWGSVLIKKKFGFLPLASGWLIASLLDLPGLNYSVGLVLPLTGNWELALYSGGILLIEAAGLFLYELMRDYYV